MQIARLDQQLQDRENQLAEAKAKYHRAAAEGADITDALTRSRQDSQQLRYVDEAARMRCPGARLPQQGIACSWPPEGVYWSGTLFRPVLWFGGA